MRKMSIPLLIMVALFASTCLQGRSRHSGSHHYHHQRVYYAGSPWLYQPYGYYDMGFYNPYYYPTGYGFGYYTNDPGVAMAGLTTGLVMGAAFSR